MLRKITPVVLLLMFSGLANALGLGDIEMRSALNQPLDAEIPLVSVSPGETDDMLVTLASQEAFQRAGIDRPFSLTQLKFSVETKGDGSAVVKVASKKPIVEPFLNFLIEVDWPNGRLIREYTVLLDPPVFMTQKAGESSPEAKVENQRNAELSAPKNDASKARVASPAAENTEVETNSNNSDKEKISTGSDSASASTALIPEYGPVKSDDTLWVIANSVRSDNVHVNQMMIAILQLNPNSFIQGNINLLKKGVVLRIPDPDVVKSISAEEAFGSVKQQNVLWREYVASVRKTKAIEVAETEKASDTAAPVPATEAPSESSQNQVVATKEESEVAKSESETDQGQLKLVGESKTVEAEKTSQIDTASSESGAENQKKIEALTSELALAEEELETQKLENNELNSRINELEESLSKMERLITLRENQLSELQDRLADSKSQVDTDSATEESTPAQQPIPAEPAEKEVPAKVEQNQESPVAQTSTDGSGSFIDRLSGQRNMLAIGAVILALILVLLYVRRKKAADGEELRDEVVVAEPKTADDLIDSLPEEAPDVAEHSETIVTPPEDSIDETDQADSTVVQEGELDRTVVIDDSGIDNLDPTVQVSSDEQEPVKDDTIAEADVYLAYGLYGQAEDLLKLAIEDNPTKEDYHFKLLETYYADKNAAEFADGAQAYHEILGGKESQLWDKAAAMGKDLCPDNPLFSDADTSKLSGGDYPGDGTEMPDGATMIIGQNDGYDRLGENSQEKLDETVLVGGNKDPDFGSEDSTQLGEDESALTAVHESSEENFQGENEVNLDSDLDLDATSTQGLEFDIDELAENPELLDSESGGTFTEAAGLDFDMDENDLSNTNIELSATDLDLSNIESSQSSESGTLDEQSAEVENLYDIDSTSIDDEAAVDIDEDAAEPGTYILDDTFMDDESLSLDMTGGFDIGGNDEVDTMLDLAKAYIDMGDTKSANSTLKEVAESGSEEQQVEAKKLLEQIA